MLRPILLAAAVLLAAPAIAQEGEGEDLDTELVEAPPPPPQPAPAPPPLVYDGPDNVDLSQPPDFVGELTDDDPMRDGKPHDTFTFDADRGHEVTVTMTAGDFDTYLVVESPDGQEWANDDFGSTRVSQVTFNAPEAGTYTIVATAWSDSGRGRYEVRATALRAEILSTVSGRLDYQDRQLVKGEYVDTFTVQGPRDGTFYITLTPLGFSGYLRVTSPTGTETRGQYNYSEQTIRLGPFQVERGDWTVDVTTLAADEVGAYDVRVVALEGE